MKPAKQKPHVSASQLELAGSCPEAYRRVYMENERGLSTIPMSKGTALHGAAQVNFQQKTESYRDLRVSEIVDVAVAQFDQGLKVGGIVFTAEETSVGPANVLGAARDDVADLAEVHAKQQAPDYQPLLVEETVRIELPGPADLLAVIDLQDDQRRVVDFKTAKRRKNHDEAHKSTQLTLYAAAYHALNGELPDLVRLDTVVQSKTKTERQILDSTRDASHFEAVAARVNTLNAMNAAGIYPPTTRGNWKCSAKWCQFWPTCRYIPESERRAGGSDSE